MPYYQGDYYQGGVFDVFKKVVGTVAGNLPVVGTVYRGASTAYNLLRGGSSSSSPFGPQAGIPGSIPSRPPPQQFALGGGRIGERPGGYSKKDVSKIERAMMGRKSRRMNVTNPKALRRAIRRQAGFVKLAKKALKGTGYTIVSRGSTRKRHVIKESGPGGVVVQ